MAGGVESEGPSADSALLFHGDGAEFNPDNGIGSDNSRLAIVWLRSDLLKGLLGRRDPPDDEARLILKAFLIMQLPTLFLYWQMEAEQTPSKPVSLYILLFPGEARDQTGIKDLNEKVIGQWWNSQYQQKRYDAIQAFFDKDEFIVAAQTYKTAFIITYTKKREDFVARLKFLDEALRLALLGTLQDAHDDKSTTREQMVEINKLTRKLRNKGYRFDIFFGLRILERKSKSSLENVYLLVTEAMKGAALARFVAKTQSLHTRAVKEVASGPMIKPDHKKLDPRGKAYEWKVYMRASNLGEAIKSMVIKGKLPSIALELNQILLDKVWTLSFMEYKNLYWGNPDVVRDVRKKKLELPKTKEGNVTASFHVQKDLLELWLVVLNMLDFVKRFKSDEFGNKVQAYHDRALAAFVDLDTPNRKVDWDNLQFVLTHDFRQTSPIAVIDTSSEYQFYSLVSDFEQRIFFSMDIRDLGVELLLSHERSNREVGLQKYSDHDLMQATFRSDDPIDIRRRHTYDSVVAVFRKYYHRLASSPRGAAAAAREAFGSRVDSSLGSFTDSVQFLLGGDEVYIATHPLFAEHVPAIIGELEKAPFGPDRTLDMRGSVAFSSAEKSDPAGRREATQRSHQEALKLAELAPGTLKSLERTKRRIERLIDMIEANDKKKTRGPAYRQELAKLPLTKLFARVKHGWPQPLSARDYARLYAALLSEDLDAAVQEDQFELVDFAGKPVDLGKLKTDAETLENNLHKDVGVDNKRVHPPPIVRIPKWIQKLIDLLEPKDPDRDR